MTETETETETLRISWLAKYRRECAIEAIGDLRDLLNTVDLEDVEALNCGVLFNIHALARRLSEASLLAGHTT